MQELTNKIVAWIKNYATANKIQSLVVGVSGGVDSGVVSTLCAMTGLRTYVVSLPINQAADQLKLNRVPTQIQWLQAKFGPNVTYCFCDLTKMYEAYTEASGPINSDLNLANAKSRLRMIMLYDIAGFNNGIVVGTGNKVEDFGVGFYTKYGDGGVDISPIASLTKTEVRQMAKFLGLPEEVATAVPTDGLWADSRTDEDQLGATYEELEWAMDFAGDCEVTARQAEVLKIYNARHKANQHKMLPIPVFRM